MRVVQQIKRFNKNHCHHQKSSVNRFDQIKASTLHFDKTFKPSDGSRSVKKPDSALVILAKAINRLHLLQTAPVSLMVLMKHSVMTRWVIIDFYFQ